MGIDCWAILETAPNKPEPDIVVFETEPLAVHHALCRVHDVGKSLRLTDADLDPGTGDWTFRTEVSDGRAKYALYPVADPEYRYAWSVVACVRRSEGDGKRTYRLAAYDKDGGYTHVYGETDDLSKLKAMGRTLAYDLDAGKLIRQETGEPYDWLEIVAADDPDFVFWASYPLPFVPIRKSVWQSLPEPLGRQDG